MKVPLLDVDEVQEGQLSKVDFFGRPVVVVRRGGELAAYVNVCTHLGGPVELRNGVLECAWHGACFDLHTGKANRGPAPMDSRLIRLPTRIENGKLVYVYGEP